jgi:hypothetical protein
VRSFVAVAALASLSACGGKDSLGPGTGTGTGKASLDVVVKDVSMAVVAGATVTTDPATKSVTTGADGHARFSGLAPKAYTVSAAEPTAGEATADITLQAGESRALTMILRKQGGTDMPDGGAGGAAGGEDAGGDTAPAADGPSTSGPTILLQDLAKDTNAVNLRWSSTAVFPTYRIYRGTDPGSGFSIIDILNDATAQTYRDPTVTLGTSYHYEVAGVAADGTEVRSNSQTITAGVFIAVNSQVERMKADPQRPYLYAIDKVNNSLHFVNLTNLTVEKTIFIGSAPTALDINSSGTELYVANSGSTEIAVADLTTRVKSRSVLVTATTSYPNGNPYRLVSTAGNTFVYSAMDSFSQLVLANGATGATITTTNTSNGGAMIASPDGTHVYSSGYSLVRFDIVGATMKQVDTTNDFNGSSTINLSRSGDGMYLFYGAKKVLATNLKSTLGTFPEPILLANSDGSVAVGGLRVYDGGTFVAKATLPLSTPVIELDHDDKTLYLYHSLTSRIYVWKIP